MNPNICIIAIQTPISGHLYIVDHDQLVVFIPFTTVFNPNLLDFIASCLSWRGLVSSFIPGPILFLTIKCVYLNQIPEFDPG